MQNVINLCGREKLHRVREKSVKSQGIFLNLTCGNPDKIFRLNLSDGSINLFTCTCTTPKPRVAVQGMAEYIFIAYS